MYASHNGHSEIVQNVLASGAQVDLQMEDGWTALSVVVLRLLASRAQVNLQSDGGWSALMLASQNGHIVL